MARRRRAPNSLAERIRGLELDTWEQTTQIVRRIGIEVSWAKIADIMISGEGVESDNFVTGVSGWKIDGDGNAEFNNVTVRGTIYATGGEISGDLEIVSGGKIITRSGADDSGLTIYPSGLIEFQPGDLTAPSLSAYPNINLGGADDSVQIESGLPNSGSVSRISVGTNNAPGFSGLISMLALGVGAQILVSSNNTIGFSTKTVGGTANTAPYVFTITNNPSSADLFQLNLGVTNRFKVRNDGRIMTSGAYMYFNNLTAAWLGVNTLGNLSISGNILYFTNTNEYIQLSDSANYFRIVQDGAETHRFSSNGDIAIAGKRIVFDIIGGNEWIDVSDSTQQFRIGLNGIVEMTLGTTGFIVPNVYNSAASQAANVYVHTDSRIYRGGQSRPELKEDIRPWARDGNILALSGITFYPLGGNLEKGEKLKRLGTRKLLSLDYHEVAKHFPKGIASTETLDWQAIAVGILEEVKQLRQEVDELKAA
jgi:hypothetical protein